MYKMSLFFGFLFLSQLANAIEINPEQLQFSFVATEGGEYVSCTSEKGTQPHQFNVSCKENKKEFKIHLLLREYYNSNFNETVVEFHYWVDERKEPIKSNTQSNWFTLEQFTRLKKIVSYTGLDNDIHQLRVEIKL